MKKLRWLIVIFSGTLVGCLSQIQNPQSYLANWTSYQSAYALSGVLYAQDQFVVVGSAGTILTSRNGFNWVTHSSDVSNDLIDVTYDTSNARFLAYGTYLPNDSSKYNITLSSPDASVWSILGQGPQWDTLKNIVSSRGYYYACAFSQILRSSDLNSWTWLYSFPNKATTSWCNAAITVGTRFYFPGLNQGQGGLYYIDTADLPTDASTVFNLSNANLPSTAGQMWSIAAFNNTYLAVGDNNSVFSSTDGINFQSTSITNLRNLSLTRARILGSRAVLCGFKDNFYGYGGGYLFVGALSGGVSGPFKSFWFGENSSPIKDAAQSADVLVAISQDGKIYSTKLSDL